MDWPSHLAFLQVLEHGKKQGRRLARRGERVKLMDELEAEQKQLQRDRDAFDDDRARTLQRFADWDSRRSAIEKLCDAFINDLMPDYVTLLRERDETLDLLHRLQRVLKPNEIPVDIKAELARREESGETSARKAHFAEVCAALLQGMTGKDSAATAKAASVAKRPQRTTRDDPDQDVREAIAQLQGDPPKGAA